MSSKVSSIAANEENTTRANNDLNPKKNTLNHNKQIGAFLGKIVSSLKEMMKCKNEMRKIVHSIKVGIALVLVSLLYLLDPLFTEVGENAMWAIMTVVVVFEFYAGATLSKGINRGIGTILGGGLGCAAALLADEFGKIGNCIIVASSVFIFGAAATYCRMIPKIKRRHDYGAMIFILTFNLVVVSGLRADTVMKLAGQRLSTIGMGFAVCIFTSLLIFPMWASDELHHSTAAKFQKLACSIEGCLEEYFGMESEKEDQGSVNLNACKSVLHSKSTDESLANFARWEPWHGKFGIFYPWEKYLKIGEILRELAALLLSLKECINSSKQPEQMLRQTIKESSETIGSSVSWILRELGESIKKMSKCESKVRLSDKFQAMKQESTRQMDLLLKIRKQENDNNVILGITTFYFLLIEVVEKVEVLAKEVDELGELACFQPRVPEV